VFVWNHRSNFDLHVVGRLVQRDFGAVADRELKRVPLYALASRFVPITFVDQADGRAATASIEPCVRLLTEGVSILVAPEGTQATGRDIGAFEQAAFRMAMAAKVPVVPIVIRNAEEVRSPSSRGVSPGTIQVAVLPPVRVDDWTLRDLDRNVDSVRQQFVRTLASWPRGGGRHRPRRKQK